MSHHQRLEIPVAEILPRHREVLEGQGMPARGEPPPHVAALLEDALELLSSLSSPVGIFAPVTGPEFAEIFRGQGQNAEPNPLAGIHPQAERLALFAVTLGGPVSEKITSLFAARDFALAAMLDSAASAAADLAADALQQRYSTEAPGKTLRYSPGYCGWHVSGQRALFDFLQPERIGITLRESFLMEPLKSISGVLVTGPGRIHEFADDYEFCDGCRDRGCRARIRSVTSGPERKKEA